MRVRREQERDGKTAGGRASGVGKGVFAAVIVAVGRYRETTTRGKEETERREKRNGAWSYTVVVVVSSHDCMLK